MRNLKVTKAIGSCERQSP
ncbi:Protein of unknown function [Lactobacillus helveticus CIRM-BIA 951]|nr:Protein of unknown function [Lactobacillus helveticus CIRM-BIA 951]CDI61342.1 Protein of unknown function [Lactobacillus helveticus CIRM-BIA 104]